MSSLVQKPAPQFTCKAVVDGQFKDVSLSHYKGKFVVLLFYVSIIASMSLASEMTPS